MLTILRRKMLEQGLTVRELSRLVGGQESTFSWVCSSKRACPEKYREPIARLVELDPEQVWDQLGRARLEGE